MGASGWYYFIPYKEDPEEALGDLKKREFSAGNYVFLPLGWVYVRDKLKEAPEMEAKLPKTLEDLYHFLAEEELEFEGTHSILDIRGLDLLHNAFPGTNISEEHYRSVFKDLKPDRKKIIELGYPFMEYKGRFGCTFLTVYKDEKPVEYYFVGYSGD